MFIISIARDMAFNFIYEQFILNLYFNKINIFFFSPLDNEVPLLNSNIILLPGGYPELYINILKKSTKFYVIIRKLMCFIYTECGGYIFMGQKLIINKICYNTLGLLFTINKFKKNILNYCKIIPIYKNNLKFVLLSHQYHTSYILSRINKNFLFILFNKFTKKIYFNGLYNKNIFGSYLHILNFSRC